MGRTFIFELKNLILYDSSRMSNNSWMVWLNIQKQPSWGDLRKRCSEYLQKIYRRTPMPKCGFNKFALQLYWNCTFARVFSCRFAAYFIEITLRHGCSPENLMHILFKSHFDMGVLLKIWCIFYLNHTLTLTTSTSCIFSKHLFLRTSLEGCFWTLCVFFIVNSVYSLMPIPWWISGYFSVSFTFSFDQLTTRF